jgi:hypothetical protein
MFEGAGHLGKLYRREQKIPFSKIMFEYFVRTVKKSNDTCKNNRIVSHNSHYTFIY